MIAETFSGPVRGVAAGAVTVFRGVPYAAPPVGDLRFRAPVPAAPWHDARDASAHGPIAPQSPSRLAPAMGDYARPQDEDCLTLTIWTPATSGSRPVLVWLHGGAWTSGAGSLDWYDGAHLAAEGDIVVVNVNYRLGALGYLVLPGLSDGNLGSADQALALAWVRDNIAAFGGDAACVTLAGQSAGAASIGRLLLDPATRPLFHRAILQSGSFGRPPRTVAEGATLGAQFARLMGIDPDSPTRLRTASVPDLLAAQGAQARANARFGETTPPFMPVLPHETTRDGLIADTAEAAGGMAILIGATREEIHAFYASNPAMAEPDPAQAEARLAGTLAHWQRRRPGGTPMDWLADQASDATFIGPAMRLAAALRGPTWAYQFDWSPPASRFRACHCIELPFVFGTFDAFAGAGMLAGGDPAGMAALSGRIRRCWIDFVRDGTPGPDWPRHEPARRMTMRLDTICEAASDPAGLVRESLA